MKKIFIDANIYLGFYNSNKPEFRKLLKSLVELSDKLLVTQQVLDEVNRNKLTVFRESIDNYTRQANIAATLLPVHLDSDEDPKVKTWNGKRKKLEDEAIVLNKELLEIFGQLMDDIAHSRDKVSNELKKILVSPVTIQEDTLRNAIIRKQIGNPPGKNSDPVGDQLSWEQILENLEGVTDLWVVSNDYDYFTAYEQKLFLNPLLYNELIKINPKINVKVFNKLSDALKDYSDKEKVKSLPPEKELKIISQDEPDIHLPPGAVRPITGKFFGEGFPNPEKCNYCGAENAFADGGYLTSKNGRIAYVYVCKQCNLIHDPTK